MPARKQTGKKASKGSPARKGSQAAAKKSGAKKSAAAKSAPATGTSKKRAAKKGAAKKSVGRRAVSPKAAPSGVPRVARDVTGRSFPGFDTGSYPGDDVMRAWFRNPYVFVGFYFDAPCHVDTTSGGRFRPWMGHLRTLKEIGWGLVLIYVGRQGRGCGATRLSRDRGLADARDAINKAAGEGVRRGAVIFLDVELVDTMPANLLRYVRGWLAGVLADGRYEAGIYCHFRNANALHAAARQEYIDQGRPGQLPLFWVVRMPGGAAFNVATSRPGDLNNFGNTPIPFASVWQGRLDITSETHGGVRFGPVDQNVADSDNPSNA